MMVGKKRVIPFVGLTGGFVLILAIIWSQAATAGPASAASSCVPRPRGIVSWWPGEGHVQDIVGANHGTLQGGAGFEVGQVGQAISLDGVDDFVSIPFNETFNFAPGDQFTIELWVNPGRRSTLYQAIVVRDVFEWDWGLWQRDNFGDNIFVTGRHESNLFGQFTATLGEWVHVAVTYHNGAYNLYVNGVPDTLGGTQSPITQSDAGLAIGRRVDSYYLGLLDEVTLYNRALSAAEIQAIHAAGNAGKCIDDYLFLPIVQSPCQGNFVDDFSDSGTGWPSGNDSQREFGYLGGEYRILLKRADYWTGVRPGVRGTDLRVSVDVRNANGAEGTYGILFGLAEDWSQLYSFEIGLDGSYYIYRYGDESWTLLQVGYSSQIRTGTASNRLQIDWNDAQIKAYVNDHLLTTVTDNSFIGERDVGLITTTYDQATLDTRFDNFAVCSFSGPLSTLKSAHEALLQPASQWGEALSR